MIGLSECNETTKVSSSSDLLKVDKCNDNKESTRKRLVDIFTLQASQNAPSPVSLTPDPTEDQSQQLPRSNNQQSPPPIQTPQLSTPTRVGVKCPESFQWTPKDLRSIFQSRKKKNLTCTSPARERFPPTERKKKKHPGAGQGEV